MSYKGRPGQDSRGRFNTGSVTLILNVQNYLLQLVFTLECKKPKAKYILIELMSLTLAVALCVKSECMDGGRNLCKVYTYG